MLILDAISTVIPRLFCRSMVDFYFNKITFYCSMEGLYIITITIKIAYFRSIYLAPPILPLFS